MSTLNRLEIRGNRGKLAEKTGKNGDLRQIPEGHGNNGKTDQIFTSGPKGRGKRGKRQPGELSGIAGSAPSLLARNERRARSKREQRRLSERYRMGPNTFIRRHEEQSYTHNLLPEGSEKPTVWGYELISKAFV